MSTRGQIPSKFPQTANESPPAGQAIGSLVVNGGPVTTQLGGNMEWYMLVLLIVSWSRSALCLTDVDNALEVETVKEVESLLLKDPSLPRLTRGEILSLISEIREGKDVMIVLPQNTTTTTVKPTRKTVKRRRKPVRPVYRPSSTTSPSEAPTESSTKDEKERPLFITPEFSTVPTSTIKLTTSRPKTTTQKLVEPQPDVAVAAESLGPDMKELLSSFGLLGQTSTTEKVTFIGDISPTVDPSSYSRFKPLPLKSDGMSPEMKSFLSSFGLLDNRKSKAVNLDPIEQLPGKDVLEDLGVLKGRKVNHVFNPQLLDKNNTEELKKVNKILFKLKEMSDGNATDLNNEDVKELLLLENYTKLAEQENVDPISDLESSLQVKNEIKRQEPNSTTTEASETTTPEDTLSSAAGDSSPNLDESFGGAGDTTTARPNGFYFLLDWNSFVDVGTEDEPRKVNINFSPKVGDPKSFINVKIP